MKVPYLYGWLCSLLVLIFITPCYGQAGGYMFRGAIRDKAGNLWFGTTGVGVYRYDAVSKALTTLTTKDGLPSDHVSAILEDKAGNLWFNTDGGVCRYDGKTFSQFATKESLCPFGVNALLEDRNGDIWFGGMSGRHGLQPPRRADRREQWSNFSCCEVRPYRVANQVIRIKKQTGIRKTAIQQM